MPTPEEAKEIISLARAAWDNPDGEFCNSECPEPVATSEKPFTCSRIKGHTGHHSESFGGMGGHCWPQQPSVSACRVCKVAAMPIDSATAYIIGLVDSAAIARKAQRGVDVGKMTCPKHNEALNAMYKSMLDCEPKAK